MNAAVHFNRIDVRRMPGFPRGGLAIENLAAGVNVVYGPNASGKTTLSRAMQRLLRPHASGCQVDSLTGELTISGQPYKIDYHLGQVVCRSGGNETSVPPLAPAAVGERYVLALHDLIQQEDERDIVQQILGEAAGGYDIPAAAIMLGFDRDRPSGRRIKAVSEYEEAVRKRKDAEERLFDIDREERQLAGLEKERKIAYEAQLRQRVIDDALGALDKKEHCEQAQRVLAEFPPEMAQLAGNEWKRFTDLKKNLDDHRKSIAVARDSLNKAEERCQAAGIPEEGLPAELVGTLQGRCEALRDLASNINRLDSDVVGAREEIDETAAQLGEEVSAERAADLDATTIDRLFKFVQQAEKCQQEGEAAERIASWLDVVPPGSASPECLRDGILLLQQWLAEQRLLQTTGMSKAGWLIGAGVTASVAVVMAFVHLSWLLLLLPATGLAAWPFLGLRLAVTPAATQGICDEWTGLGLSPLAAWTAAEVQVELRRLQHEWATAQLHQEKSQRFADVQQRRDKYGQQQTKIEQIRQRWRERLGVEIDVDNARLYLLADVIRRVRVAQNRTAVKTAELAKARNQYDQLLGQINDELVPYFDKPADNAAQASALVRALDQRREAHGQALEQRNRADDEIEKCKRQVAKTEEDQSKLVTDLGLKPDDEIKLREWCDQFLKYKEAKECLRLAEHDAQTAASAMAGHENLLEQTRDELKTELADCRDLASALGELDRKIGDIHGRVRRAKKETAVEAALAHERNCFHDLRAARDHDAAQLVGNVLVGYLEGQQRNFQQPGVLKRAAELFVAITHGRYRLLVESGGPSTKAGGFRALDTSLDCEHNLDELSSGTRLQLLLAVRVAFVEHQEQGLKLPLIFDETLGNSDEQRAVTIIEAAVEIARQGRQVFYFTAQQDEVAKWRRVLRDRDGVSHREFDLARIRGFSEVERLQCLAKT